MLQESSDQVLLKREGGQDPTQALHPRAIQGGCSSPPTMSIRLSGDKEPSRKVRESGFSQVGPRAGWGQEWGGKWGLGRAQMLVGWWGGQGGVCPLLLLQRQEVGVSCQWGPPGWQVSMRQAQFCWWAPWVLREEELGRGERGGRSPPQEVRLLVGRSVSRQDSVGSVLNCGFSPAPGRAFQAWGRGRLVSGLHSSVASGRPGPAGAQEPHSAIMGQWPSAPGPRGQEPQGLWESPGGACFHHHPRHLDGVLGGSVGAEDS